MANIRKLVSIKLVSHTEPVLQRTVEQVELRKLIGCELRSHSKLGKLSERRHRGDQGARFPLK